MKNSEFIELLNLYLDHEISPEKAALLEAEVKRDPARRAIYRQYCQMQKACVVLTEKFQEAAPVRAVRPGTVYAPPQRHTGLWAAGFMAAACAALAIFTRLHPAAAPAPAPAPMVAQSAPVDLAPARSDFQPVFVARGLAPKADLAANTVLFPASDTSGQFAWMQQVQMTPIARQAAAPFLYPKPALNLDSRLDVEHSGDPIQSEMSAFKFQR
jgi:hypothetical protein